MRLKFENSWLASFLLLPGLIIAALIMWQYVHSSYLLIVLVPVTLLGMHHYKILPKLWRLAYVGFLIAAISVFSLMLLQGMNDNVNHPREWDFVGFWLHGTSAVQHHNFYDPQYAQHTAQNMVLSKEFREEIVNVGFWYPPPTIFLFMPLGLFDLHTALIVWYIAQSIILVVSIIALWKWFLPESDWLGLPFVTSLVLMLYSVYQNIYYGQTNFMLLLAVILFLRHKDKWQAGLWFALCVLVKPFTAGLILYLLLKRKWSAIGVAVASVVVISLATIMIFGVDNFSSYFRGNSVGQLPTFIYTELTNQSLLASILRITNFQFGKSSPIMHPLFIAIGLVMGLITTWFAYRLDRKYDEVTISLSLMLSVIIYPPSQMFYAILLIIPLLWLWRNRNTLFGKNMGILVIGFTVLYEFLVVQDGNVTLGANLFMWVTLVWISWKLTRQPMLIVEGQLSLQT